MPLKQTLTDGELLAELEDAARSTPSWNEMFITEPRAIEWVGRAQALLARWDKVQSAGVTVTLNHFSKKMGALDEFAITQIRVLLQRAITDLRLNTVGPVSVAVGSGEVFRYFEAVRAVIEQATSDLLFVDRYMVPDFVARYLPLIKPGVTVRMLTREKVPALVASASMFAKQHNATIEVRSSANFHDRYVFVDRVRCFLSGASFKDGGKVDATTFTENVDLFPQLMSHYEAIWSAAKLEPLVP